MWQHGAGASALRHNHSLDWNSRDAPLHNGGPRGSAATWRERAALHREAIGLHKPAEPLDRTQQRSLSPMQDSGMTAQAGVTDDNDLAGDISASDLIATDNLNLILAEDEDPEINEGYSDDWWGLAMRVDLERYIAYKNAQMRVAAEEDASIATIFENSSLWRIMSEISVWERSVLRRNRRGQIWPDTMLAPGALSRDQVEEVKLHIERWTFALEDLDDIGNTRATLRWLPIHLALRQLVADALIAAGENHEARWELLLVVGAASLDKKPEVRVGQAQYAPPRIGWDDCCKCDLVKAQQCVRFGRLAVISAQEAAAMPDSQEYTPELCRIRDKQHHNTLSEEVASAIRHLTDARKLYKAELLVLAKLSEQQASRPSGSCVWGTHEMTSLRMAMRCGYLGATGLLAASYSLGGRTSQAHATYDEAIRDSSVLLGDAGATPRLQRLLAAEREKLLLDRSQRQ